MITRGDTVAHAHEHLQIPLGCNIGKAGQGLLMMIRTIEELTIGQLGRERIRPTLDHGLVHRAGPIHEFIRFQQAAYP